MIVPPFSLGENYFFSEEKVFTSYANKILSETPVNLEVKELPDVKLSIIGNKIEGKLPNAELETIQKIFDAVLTFTKLDRIKRFRGYSSLRRHGILFDKIYMPQPQTVQEA